MDKNRETLTAFYRQCLTVTPGTDPAVIMRRILADGFVSHGSADQKGKEELIQQIGFFWKLVPDLKWEPQQLVEAGDTYVVRSIASGTPMGEFMGLPTDGTKRFVIMTIDVHRVVDGVIQEVHHLEDWSTAMRQLRA